MHFSGGTAGTSTQKLLLRFLLAFSNPAVQQLGCSAHGAVSVAFLKNIYISNYADTAYKIVMHYFIVMIKYHSLPLSRKKVRH